MKFFLDNPAEFIKVLKAVKRACAKEEPRFYLIGRFTDYFFTRSTELSPKKRLGKSKTKGSRNLAIAGLLATSQDTHNMQNGKVKEKGECRDDQHGANPGSGADKSH